MDRSSKFSERQLTGLIFAGVALAYALTLTRNYYWDGIDFAMTVERARGLSPALLHPNHLIYNLVGYTVFRGVTTLFDTRSLYVLQYLNCIAAAACAVLLFRILTELLDNVKAALWLALLFAFSATWWKFATDADAYILSVLFLLAAFCYLISSGTPKPLIIAALHVAAMCFHELAVLFLPAAVVGLYLRDPGKSIRKALLYAGFAGAATLAVYAAAFYWMTGGLRPEGLLRWATSSSGETGFGFEAGRNLGYTLSGQFKLFIGGRFSSFREVYQPLGFGLAALLALALAGLVRGVLRYRQAAQPGPGRAGQRVALFTAWVWAGVYFVFLIFWEPQHTFYRLFYFPAAVILIGLWLKRFDLNALSRHLLPYFTAAIAISNLLFYSIPYAQVRAGTPLALASELTSVWPCGTRVLHSSNNSDLETIEYFNPQSRWQLAKGADLLGDPLLNEEVWIDDHLAKEVVSTPAGKAWLDAHAITDAGIGEPYEIRFIRISSGPPEEGCVHIR